jgi:hypothetical protein
MANHIETATHAAQAASDGGAGMKLIVGGFGGSVASYLTGMDAAQVISVLVMVAGLVLKIADTINQARSAAALQALKVKEDARAAELHELQKRKLEREIDSISPYGEEKETP